MNYKEHELACAEASGDVDIMLDAANIRIRTLEAVLARIVDTAHPHYPVYHPAFEEARKPKNWEEGYLELVEDRHICLWSEDRTFKWTVAFFHKGRDGFDLHFVGDRPLDARVNWDHFRELVVIGQRLADEEFKNQLHR